MNPIVAGVAIAVAVAVSQSRAATPEPQGYVRTTEPQTPEAERRGFHLPAGFEIELVASEPAIGKPINLAFDRRGRLWVTESREYPYAAADGQPRRDRLVVLDDRDGDGRIETVTPFADDLNIPTGVLPLEDGAVVWSIPNIWRLRDGDGDGRADTREILFGPLGWEKDTHGMSASFRRGLDGWMYATHGFANRSTVVGKDGSRVELVSGNTYRVRLDGSRVEPWGKGQVNPFGLTFDPRGNLYSTDSHTDPIYLLQRNGSYPSFGRPHDGLGFAPRVMEHDHGSTALAGIAYYADDAWPEEFRDNVFGGNVGTSRVHRDRLVFHGSTPTAVHLDDFLTSDDPWFRPVDLTFGPDGALYVADFYNRIISHYEVALDHPGRDRERGRIWRISYKGLGARPRGLANFAKMTPVALVESLLSPSLVVRSFATHELVARGRTAAETLRARLRTSRDERLWSHGLWALERLRALDGREVHAAAAHAAPSVKATVARILGERVVWPRDDRDVRGVAHRLLADASGDVKRAAADALARHPALTDVLPLLAALEKADGGDAQLRQGLRIAVRDELMPPGRIEGFTRLARGRRFARLVADVMPGIESAASSAFLLAHLRDHDETTGHVRRYLEHAARHVADSSLPALEAQVEASLASDREAALVVALALVRGRSGTGVALSADARAWAHELARRALVTTSPPGVVAKACELASALAAKDLAPALQALLGRSGLPLEVRAQVVSALALLAPAPHLGVLSPLVREAQLPVALRRRFADIAFTASPRWSDELSRALAGEPPRVQARAAGVLARAPTGAEALVQAVIAKQIPAAVLLDAAVARHLASIDDDGLRARIAALTRGVSRPEESVDDVIETRKKGFERASASAAQGQSVFATSCAPCHSFGGTGNLVGPQLDGVGSRGVDRLLEDIFDPNRHVDDAFRAQHVQLAGGEDVTGLFRREDAGTLVLVDLSGHERSLSKRDIVKRTESEASVMPDNFSEALSPDDTYRLLAYLMSSPVASTSSSASSFWKTHAIDPSSSFEGAAAADLDRDGRLDVFSGDRWYRAPAWEPTKVRSVPVSPDPHYLEDFADLPLDVDGDGRTDIVTCSFFGARLAWVEQPRDPRAPWIEHTLPSPGSSETCRLVDLDGDRDPDVVPATNQGVIWYELVARKPAVRWAKRVIAPDADGHGVGFGDVDGDGRTDIVKPNGWYEQPADPGTPWGFHPELSLGVAGISILVGDIDGDGDSDLVWGAAHDRGLHWLAQGRDPTTGARTWRRSAIDAGLIGVHTLIWADLDGDGTPILVTGSRVYGHERDPGATSAPAVMAFRFDRARGVWTPRTLVRGADAVSAPSHPALRNAQRDFAPGTVGTGLQMEAVDLDQDGDLDLLCPGKTGLYWLENPRRTQ